MMKQLPKREPHNLRLFYGAVLALILTALVVALTARAAPTDNPLSCASVQVNAVSGDNTAVSVHWQQSLVSAIPSVCDNIGTNQCNTPVTDSTYCGFDLPAGSPVTFYCAEKQTGVAPPAPTDITIQLVSDNSATPGFVSHDFGASCSGNVNVTTTTFFLTSTGLNTGSPRAGITRVFLSVVSTTTGATFTCDSDQTGEAPPTGGSCPDDRRGVGRSDPGFSAPNLTATAPCASGCLVYQGGDTITSTITANASAYNAGTRGSTQLQSDSGAFNSVGSAWSLSAAAIPESQLIQGNPDLWRTGALTSQWTETGNSALFTSLSYWIFTSATLASPLTLTDAHHATWSTGDQLTRNGLTCGTPTNTIDGVSGTIVNRGGFDTTTCAPWHDARGATIPNNQNAQGWYQNAGGFESWADFPSFNGTFGPQSNFPMTTQAKFSGCGTGTFPPDANGCAHQTTGLSYHKMIETCAAACAANDANLQNWGNSSGAFDVNATDTITSVTASLSAGGTNQTSFTVGSDLLFEAINALHEAAGPNVASANLTCQDTDFNQNPPIQSPNVNLGPTTASGNVPSTPIENPTLGPPDQWTMTCQGTFQGNGLSYVQVEFHTSAVTSGVNIVLLTNVTHADLSLLTHIASVSTNNQFADADAFDQPNDVHYELFAQQDDLSPMWSLQQGTFTKDPTQNLWYANLTSILPNNGTRWIHVHAWGNFTGKLFLAYRQVDLLAVGATLEGNVTGNLTVPPGSTFQGMIQTALDPFIPYILWMGLFIGLTWVRAWAPAFAALMAVAIDAVQDFSPLKAFPGLPYPLSLAFEILTFTVLLTLHVLVSGGIIPKPWGRQDDETE